MTPEERPRGAGRLPGEEPDPEGREGRGQERGGVWAEHHRYIIGIAVLLGVLAWLTFDGVHPDPVLLGFILGLAVVYRVFATSGGFSARARENLVFRSLAVGLVVVLGIVSGWSTQLLVHILTPVVFYSIFGLGLNLEFGYTGIINFGHVAFMAIGAYTTAILSIPLVEHAGVFSRSSLLLIGVLVAMAVVAFLIAGVLASILTEKWLAWKRTGWSTDRGKSASGGAREPGSGPESAAWDRRWTLIAGTAAGLVAAVLVVFVVPYPMDGMWAQTTMIAGAVLAGMLLAAFAGILLGLPTLRLRADYLAIVTIGAAEILRRIARNEDGLTGGPQGMAQLPLPLREAGEEWEWLGHLAGALDVSEYRLLLFLLAAGALLLVLAAYVILLRAPYGRVLRAIREDEDVAAALGKNVFSYKLQALAIGSAVAALAGAFLAWHRTFISPQSFLPLITFYGWIIIVVGGVGNNKGTLLGALVLFSFFETTRVLNLDENLGLSGPQGSALRVSLIGVLLILLMLFKPEGLLGRREELVLGD